MARASKAKTRRKALQMFRIERNLTQGEFAELCGISRGLYALIERGERKGTAEFWLTLKRVFCVDDDYLGELMKVETETQGNY